MSNGLKSILLLVALGSGFFASDIFHWLKASQESIEISDYCLLETRGCHIESNFISVDKDTSQPLVATQLSALWKSSDADELTLSLQGYEMEMGTVLFKLKKTDQHHFDGQVILPVCTTDAMTWYGTISDGNKDMKVAIRMER